MKNTLIINQREFIYYHFEAKIESAPILVIFHGVGFNKVPAKFRDDNINVIAIMDTFGIPDMGSWYIGENGDYFWIKAIRELLEFLKKKCRTNQIYFWGSSMGGYAAILHGYLNNVTAVYANVPQTKLLGSTYIDHSPKMKECIEFILGKDAEKSKYNELSNILDKQNNTVFIITFNQLEGLNYFSEHGFPFLRKLHGIRQKMYLEVRPNNTHGIIYNIAETLDLFQKYAKINNENLPN